MRKIKAKDFGALSKIIYKLEIKEDIKGLLFNAEKVKDQDSKNKELMIEIVFIFTENYWKAEEEILALLGNLSGREDLGEATISEIKELFMELMKDEGFQGFLESIAK